LKFFCATFLLGLKEPRKTVGLSSILPMDYGLGYKFWTFLKKALFNIYETFKIVA